MPSMIPEPPEILTNQTTVPPVSPISPSTPRKYAIPDSTPAFPVSSGVSNIDSIVEQAGGLSSVAKIIGYVAMQAATDVTAARANIAAAARAPTSSPQIKPQITENEVSQQQRRIINVVQSNLPALSSPVLNSNLISTVGDLITQSRQQFIPLRSSANAINVENRVVPDLDSVAIEISKEKGVGDLFYSRLTFSIPVDVIDSGSVASFRVFRCDIVSPNLTRQFTDISLKGMDIINSNPISNRSKNDDRISMLEHSFRSNGVANNVSTYNPIDRFIKQRVVVNPLSFQSLTNKDQSVKDDPTFINAVRLQNQNSNLYQFDNEITVGSSAVGNKNVGQAHADNLSSLSSTFALTVRGNNLLGFKQIHVSKPSSYQAKQIGTRYYYTYDDHSISFGKQYKYYVTTINEDMVQSTRSPIVTVNIDGIRIPARPKNVLISSDGYTTSLFMIVDDQFVEKFEIWKKDHQPSVAKKEFVVVTNQNGFSMVDEVVNGDHNSGANWIDSKVIPGHSYTYRVYSVDVFGNKSESPFEGDVLIPENSPDVDKTLTIPTILAEVDSKTQKIVITMNCVDAKVRRLHLERRDLTIGQENFVSPDQSARTIMGPMMYKHSSYVFGERIQDEDNTSLWNGWFDNTTGSIKFVDRLTNFDRTYQYRVYGLDELGNKTSYDYSNPVLVYRKPMINVPVNLSATAVIDSAGSVNGVTVSWQSSSFDTSSEDLLGSQIKLADTSVRTLYQLQRQKAGDVWLNFNMTPNNSYFDPVEGYSGILAPEFRPPFLQLNTTYNYRIQAVMSGGYISNTAPHVSVFVGNLVATPQNFNLTTPDMRVRPFYVMLNWDTPDITGIVDNWEIERCEVNNFAAARINIKNQVDFAKLKFELFRTVYLESSRFRSIWGDALYGSLQSEIITGQHQFMDAQVIFGNSYFYRIVAVDTRGNRSAAAYRGIKLTYPSYELLAADIYSSDEITRLTNTFAPVRFAANVLGEVPLNTMSLNPTFSTPNTGPALKPTTTIRYNKF